MRRMIDADVLVENIKNRYLDDPIKAHEFIRIVMLELDNSVELPDRSFCQQHVMKIPESCESCPLEDFGGCMFRVQREDCPFVKTPETITDEVAHKITEEANKACANCQEWVCDECEYRHWRDK